MNLLARRLISQDLAVQAINALKTLITVPESRTKTELFGICWNLRHLLDEEPGHITFNPEKIVTGRQSHGYFIVNQLSRNWKHFSGNPYYPITCTPNLEKWEGNQLELRISLMEHLISELKKI